MKLHDLQKLHRDLTRPLDDQHPPIVAAAIRAQREMRRTAKRVVITEKSGEMRVEYRPLASTPACEIEEAHAEALSHNRLRDRMAKKLFGVRSAVCQKPTKAGT